MSINHKLSCNKSLFDLFNMVNPNCYQALIIQSIISDNINDAIELCNALQMAIKYYKWETTDKNTDYIDSLICQSSLDKWQKIAIMHALGSNIQICADYLKSELDTRNKENLSKQISIDDESCHNSLLHESVMKMLHPSDRYTYWTKIQRCL